MGKEGRREDEVWLLKKNSEDSSAIVSMRLILPAVLLFSVYSFVVLSKYTTCDGTFNHTTAMRGQE